MKVDIFNTDRKYNIIYADPPWSFSAWSEKGKEKSAEKHYSVMSKEDIFDLPVKDIAQKNAVLLIWVTFPNLEQGLETIKRWGFTYKTVAFTWVKQAKKSEKVFTGLGFYTRSNAEICLLATRGKVLKRESHSVHSVIISHIREHSRKPDEARERIAQLFGGDIPKIELFARQTADGWDCWGNEV